MSSPLEKHPEKPSEDLSDALLTRVLNGLRDAQPSPGMNDRILHTLHLQATEAQLPSPRQTSRLALLLRHPWAIAEAALAASLLLAALLSLHPHRSRTTSAYIPTAPGAPPPALRLPRAPLSGTWVRSMPGAPPSPAVLSSAKVGATSARAGVPSSTAALSPAKADEAYAATPSSSDAEAAEALADTVAPSHPAPLLPLTEQEQLLLRILQRNNPVELAQLDPILREAGFARDRAAFEKFFTPPPPLPQDPPSTETPTQSQQQTISATPTSGDRP